MNIKYKKYRHPKLESSYLGELIEVSMACIYIANEKGSLEIPKDDVDTV